jgi:hypothetical protein
VAAGSSQTAFYFQAPSLIDPKLGHLLRLQPTELQQRIRRSYGTRYRLSLPYGDNQMLACSGTFRARTDRAGFTFGLNPYRPSRPFLAIAADQG